jgi:hypothetical protein
MESDDKIVRLDRDVFERLLSSQEEAHSNKAGEITAITVRVNELDVVTGALKALPLKVDANTQAVQDLRNLVTELRTKVVMYGVGASVVAGVVISLAFQLLGK